MKVRATKKAKHRAMAYCLKKRDFTALVANKVMKSFTLALDLRFAYLAGLNNWAL
jgi:hypothetical protein